MVRLGRDCRAAPAARCLALGRLGGRHHLFGSWRALSSPVPTSHALALRDLHPGPETADRACRLLGLWEGSQWFAKNSPKSWLCLPAGSRAPPWSGAQELADGPFMFPVTGTPSGHGSGGGRLGWQGRGWHCCSSQVFGWNLRREGSSSTQNLSRQLPPLSTLLPPQRVWNHTRFLLFPSLAVCPWATHLTSLCLILLCNRNNDNDCYKGLKDERR